MPLISLQCKVHRLKILKSYITESKREGKYTAWQSNCDFIDVYEYIERLN